MNYIVFGAKYCDFCKKTKLLLDEKKIKYKYYDLASVKEKTYDFYEEYIPTDYFTIPKILIEKNKKDIKFIGGYDDLVKLLKKNSKTKKRVKKRGGGDSKFFHDIKLKKKVSKKKIKKYKKNSFFNDFFKKLW